MFPDPPGNQLIELGAEVDDDDHGLSFLVDKISQIIIFPINDLKMQGVFNRILPTGREYGLLAQLQIKTD
jgi:hypothetical protein